MLRFQGIDKALADAVRGTMRAPEYGHPAHRDTAQGYDAPALPPDLRSLPLVFERTRADYVHIRNGEVGCLIARVERPRPGGSASASAA